MRNQEVMILGFFVACSSSSLSCGRFFSVQTGLSTESKRVMFVCKGCYNWLKPAMIDKLL